MGEGSTKAYQNSATASARARDDAVDHPGVVDNRHAAAAEDAGAAAEGAADGFATLDYRALEREVTKAHGDGSAVCGSAPVEVAVDERGLAAFLRKAAAVRVRVACKEGHVLHVGLARMNSIGASSPSAAAVVELGIDHARRGGNASRGLRVEGTGLVLCGSGRMGTMHRSTQTSGRGFGVGPGGRLALLTADCVLRKMQPRMARFPTF